MNRLLDDSLIARLILPDCNRLKLFLSDLKRYLLRSSPIILVVSSVEASSTTVTGICRGIDLQASSRYLP
ncbi:MAG: hypothetical protein WC879_06110 [Melioribacteraceae bacterium]